ncbi:unnamed protein product, partial [Arabidopsis halleri]
FSSSVTVFLSRRRFCSFSHNLFFFSVNPGPNNGDRISEFCLEKSHPLLLPRRLLQI